MKQKIIVLLLFALVALTGISNAQQGQQVEKNFELGEVIRIAAAYQETPFLSFQAQIVINDSASNLTDSTGFPATDTIQGTYKLHDGRHWIMLDSVEYVQGYMYNLAVYHDDKIISVAKPSIDNKLLQLAVLDSTFHQAFVQNVTVIELDSNTRSLTIEFNEGAPYKSYEMRYNKSSYLLQSISYYMKNGEENENNTAPTVSVKTSFYNYSSVEISPDVFIEDKYIYKDAEGFKTKPDYSAYQIITMDGDL